MKLETAKALKWPWPCKEWTMHERERIPYPSVEEMLERMPNILIKKDGEGTYGAAFGGKKWMIKTSKDPSEALALLCIWLRDNGLMEWRER